MHRPARRHLSPLRGALLGEIRKTLSPAKAEASGLLNHLRGKFALSLQDFLVFLSLASNTSRVGSGTSRFTVCLRTSWQDSQPEASTLSEGEKQSWGPEKTWHFGEKFLFLVVVCRFWFAYFFRATFVVGTRCASSTFAAHHTSRLSHLLSCLWMCSSINLKAAASRNGKAFFFARASERERPLSRFLCRRTHEFPFCYHLTLMQASTLVRKEEKLNNNLNLLSKTEKSLPSR